MAQDNKTCNHLVCMEHGNDFPNNYCLFNTENETGNDNPFSWLYSSDKKLIDKTAMDYLDDRHVMEYGEKVSSPIYQSTNYESVINNFVNKKTASFKHLIQTTQKTSLILDTEAVQQSPTYGLATEADVITSVMASDAVATPTYIGNYDDFLCGVATLPLNASTPNRQCDQTEIQQPPEEDKVVGSKLLKRILKDCAKGGPVQNRSSAALPREPDMLCRSFIGRKRTRPATSEGNGVNNQLPTASDSNTQNQKMSRTSALPSSLTTRIASYLPGRVSHPSSSLLSTTCQCCPPSPSKLQKKVSSKHTSPTKRMKTIVSLSESCLCMTFPGEPGSRDNQNFSLTTYQESISEKNPTSERPRSFSRTSTNSVLSSPSILLTGPYSPSSNDYLENPNLSIGCECRDDGKIRFRCLECSVMCSSFEALKTHHRHAHHPSKYMPHTCLTCKGVFSGASKLNRHRIVHTETYKTNWIKKHCSWSKNHVSCRDCGALYRSRTTLQRHQRCHLIMPIKDGDTSSQICGALFETRGNLKNHLKYFHKTENPTPGHQCTKCLNVYKTITNLNRHKCDELKQQEVMLQKRMESHDFLKLLKRNFRTKYAV